MACVQELQQTQQRAALLAGDLAHARVLRNAGQAHQYRDHRAPGEVAQRVLELARGFLARYVPDLLTI